MTEIVQPLANRGAVLCTVRALILCFLVAASANPQVARAQDDNVAKLIERAQSAYFTHNWKSAQKLANEALELDPNQSRAHVILGDVAWDRAHDSRTVPGDRPALFSECVAEYRRALSIEYVPRFALSAVQCALDAGDPSTALQLSDEMEQWLARQYSPAQLARDGNYATCRGKKGEALAALGRQAEATAAYESGVRAWLAIAESDKAGGWHMPTYLRPYNEYRAKVGLPPISVDQLTAATAESVAAELNHSSTSNTSTAVPNPGSAALAQTPSAVAGNAAQEPGSAAAADSASDAIPCELAILPLALANTDDTESLDTMYANSEKLVETNDLRGICNLYRKSYPVQQRIAAQTEQLVAMTATCPGLEASSKDYQEMFDMARSNVIDIGWKIELCPPEQHHWQEVSAGGELKYLFDAKRPPASGYPTVWVRIPNNGEPVEQLFAFDCGNGRFADLATISYADPAGTSASGWTFSKSLSWEYQR